VEYQEYQWYEPLDDATAQAQLQNLTVWNVALIGVVNNPLGPVAIDFFAPQFKDSSKLFITLTAQEVIFGYDDPLLAILAANGVPVPARFPGIQNNDSSFAYAAAVHSPIAMYTGKYNTEMMYEYLQWDGMEQMQCCALGPCGDILPGNTGAVYPWTTPEASYIRGTEGSNFKMGLSADDNIYIGTYDFGIYRHWEFATSADDTYDVQGISAYKFQYVPGTLLNATSNLIDGPAYQGYGPNGLLNQSMCESGAPVYLSNPR
jgi:hypothetical protein